MVNEPDWKARLLGIVNQLTDDKALEDLYRKANAALLSASACGNSKPDDAPAEAKAQTDASPLSIDTIDAIGQAYFKLENALILHTAISEKVFDTDEPRLEMDRLEYHRLFCFSSMLCDYVYNAKQQLGQLLAESGNPV